jgi:hypothetical protein
MDLFWTPLRFGAIKPFGVSMATDMLWSSYTWYSNGLSSLYFEFRDGNSLNAAENAFAMKEKSAIFSFPVFPVLSLSLSSV